MAALEPNGSLLRKVFKTPNIQKQLRKKIPNYLRKQSLIFPQRSLLAEKARRNHSGQLVGLTEKAIVLSTKQGFSRKITHLLANQEDPPPREHLTQIRHGSAAGTASRRQKREGSEPTTENSNAPSPSPRSSELFPTLST